MQNGDLEGVHVCKKNKLDDDTKDGSLLYYYLIKSCNM